jgi:sulfatase maturation enzyme AslB (radical SAM superfamily)
MVKKTEADPSILNLQRGGHLTELTLQEEIHHIETMYKKYMETHPIMNQYMIIIAYNCNLRCPYCYLSHLHTKTADGYLTS